eukprot:4441890-Amphidinium_carterae.1
MCQACASNAAIGSIVALCTSICSVDCENKLEERNIKWSKVWWADAPMQIGGNIHIPLARQPCRLASIAGMTV